MTLVCLIKFLSLELKEECSLLPLIHKAVIRINKNSLVIGKPAQSPRFLKICCTIILLLRDTFTGQMIFFFFAPSLTASNLVLSSLSARTRLIFLSRL